jgi:hypothetical protein
VGAPAGTFYLLVDYTLQNVSATTPLSTSFAFLSLETAQALVVAASANEPSGSCSTNVSLAIGGHVECQVAFEVPAGQTPATLKYDDLRGDKASAAVPAVDLPPPPSGACDTVVGWFGTSPSSTCLSCVQTSQTGACSKSASAYSSACTTCGNTCTGNPTTMCSCERGCDSTSCQALFDQTMACIASACGASCP